MTTHTLGFPSVSLVMPDPSHSRIREIGLAGGLCRLVADSSEVIFRSVHEEMGPSVNVALRSFRYVDSGKLPRMGRTYSPPHRGFDQEVFPRSRRNHVEDGTTSRPGREECR